MPTIALENVTKYYQTGKHGWTEKQVETGVEDVSLTIEQGDFVFVIGSSGAGKSTLLDLISGQMSRIGRCPPRRQGFVKADALELYPDRHAVWKGPAGAIPDPEDDGGGEFDACGPGRKKAGISETAAGAD